MGDYRERFVDPAVTRRDFLARCGMGMGGLMAAGMMSEAAAASASPLLPRAGHFPGRVKRVIHLMMNGGPSQVDTFDPKPMLTKWHGKELPNTLPTERPTGAALGSPFSFEKYGESGLEVSELFAKTAAAAADDLCVIRSMHADVPNHEPSLMLMNCGDSRFSRPSLGSWLSYGLGTENQNLPAFVVLCPGLPTKGSENWRASFLPGSFQATHIDVTRGESVEELIENIRNRRLDREVQRGQLNLLRRMNERHLLARERDAALETRLQSFELAYRMQMEATDAFDVEREPKHVRDMYGEGIQARQILMARRLIERGVRFVQVWHGKGQPWDSHDDVEKNHRKLAGECDQAIAALLSDLKQRGMLEDTLVIWGGEFGRTPVVELPAAGTNVDGKGRDHNHHGFSMWLAGGGVKGGHVHGATDEFGFAAIEDRVHVHDLHATILRLLGFDHEKLTYRYAGRDFRLTDVHGNVIDGILI